MQWKRDLGTQCKRGLRMQSFNRFDSTRNAEAILVALNSGVF